MESVFLVIAALCYSCGTVGYLIYLFRDVATIHRAAWWILLTGASFHLMAIVIRSIATEHLAVTSSQEAMSFFALVLVVTYLSVQIRLDIRILGSFVSPLAIVFMMVSTLLPGDMMPTSSVFKSGWVAFHVSTLFFANALFALAFCAGIMYLMQEHYIKKKDFGFLYTRLPSLQRLDKINHHCLLLGFPFMTIGLITGFAYASAVWQSPWNWDPKEIFALITWCIYAVLLHERLTVGWRGKKAALMAIIGFVGVLMTFLGVNLIFKGHHTFFVG